ncbi:MAG TPA: hypothetical protein GXX20_05650 [Clostridiaceae bacterium]|nr:hypothetical protein [Clostridiaceae bacterium]
MDKYSVMENVANSLLAASKIRKMYTPVSGDLLQAERGQSVSIQSRPQPDQIMEVIAHYSPEKYKSSLSNTVRICADYTNSYRNLKRNFTLAKNRGISSDTIASTIAAMRPILDNKSKVLVSKVLKIYEILKS